MDDVESSLPERWAEMLPDLLEDLGRAAAKPLVKKIAARKPELFFGFRPTPEALLSPAVRPRFLKAAEESPDMAQELLAAWRERRQGLLEEIAALPEGEKDALPELAARFGSRPVRLALCLNGKEAPVPAPEEPDIPQAAGISPAGSPPEGESERREREALRERADRLKAEQKAREKAESEARAAEAKIAEMRRLTLAAHEEKERLQKQADRLQRQVERGQSARDALEEEVRDLAKSLHSLQKSYEEALGARPDAERVLLNALRSLLESGEAGAVASFCRTLKRQNALGESAREYYIAALESLSETGEAVSEQLERAQQALDAGMPSQALRLACEAWDRHPRHPKIEAFLEDLLAARRSDAAFLHRVEGWLTRWPLSPAARARARAAARPPGEAPRHQGRPFGPEKAFLWGGRRYRASALEIVRAVDRNDEALVEAVRADLRAKRRDSPAWVRQFFQTVGGLDDSCKVVLGAPELTPVVMDGSNAAWHGKRPGDAPDLDHILLLRETLRRKGCFPVVVYIDAALVFQSSLPDTVRRWVQEEQIVMADAGIDADELIVREAARRGCPIATNDRLREWDPDNRLLKWRFQLYGEEVLIETESQPF